MNTTSRNSSSTASAQRYVPATAALSGDSAKTARKNRVILSEQALARAPLRRLPAQQRSIVRVQRMLDACAELLDESGYTELSTTKIAERAGVAIGSVYQFFPDKRAITQALGLRYLDIFTMRVADRLAEESFGHWTEAVDAIIDEYIDMHRNEPGFRSLHFGDVVDVRLLDSDSENNRVIASRLRDLLISVAGASNGAKLDRAAIVAVEAADAVLKLAFRNDSEGDPYFITETKLLVRGYLEQLFGSKPQAHHKTTTK